MQPTPSLEEQGMKQQESGVDADEKITCVRCGKEAVPLHRGCKLCEDCCDCRPSDEA